MARITRSDVPPGEEVSFEELFEANAEPIVVVYKDPCTDAQTTPPVWGRLVDGVLLDRPWQPFWRVVMLGIVFALIAAVLLVVGAYAFSMVFGSVSGLALFVAIAKRTARPVAAFA